LSTEEEKNERIETLKNGNASQKNAAKILEYRKMANEFENGDYLFTLSEGIGRGARLGGSTECQLFYKGKTGKIKYIETHNPTFYNSVVRGTGLSDTKAFCGKVRQYNKITGIIRGRSRNIESNNTEFGTDLIGLRTEENESGVENNYRINEFRDCVCLNSPLAEHRNLLMDAAKEAQDRGVENLDSGESITPQTIAQNNDNTCVNYLVGDGFNSGLTAYVANDRKRNAPLNICFSTTFQENVEVGNNASFTGGSNCNLDDKDESKIGECLDNPELEKCKNLFGGGGSIFDDVDDNTIFIIVGISIAVLLVIVILVIVLKKKK